MPGEGEGTGVEVEEALEDTVEEGEARGNVPVGAALVAVARGVRAPREAE